MKKLIMIISTILITGCSEPEYSISDRAKERMVEPFFLNDDLVPFDKVKSINEEYPIEITTSGGTKKIENRVVYLYNDFYVDIMRSCINKINLNSSDVENTRDIFLTYFKGIYLELKDKENKKITNDVEKCTANYLENNSIHDDYLAYFLEDDRIKKNINYPFLNDAVTLATKDNKITYVEIYNIYSNLDKALEQNLAKQLSEYNLNLNLGKKNE